MYSSFRSSRPEIFYKKDVKYHTGNILSGSLPKTGLHSIFCRRAVLFVAGCFHALTLRYKANAPSTTFFTECV